MKKIKEKHESFEFLLFIGTHPFEGKKDKSERRPSERMFLKRNSLNNRLLGDEAYL